MHPGVSMQGLFCVCHFSDLYLQPEVVFASNSYDYNVTTVTGEDLLKQKFSRLISRLFQYGFKLGPLRLNAGPAASILIGSPKALIDDPNFEEMYKSAVFGFQAGAGIDIFNKLTLDVRYAGSLGRNSGDSVSESPATNL